MRKTTKLAGTNDIAKITHIDTSTSTEVVTLKENRFGLYKESSYIYLYRNLQDMSLEEYKRKMYMTTHSATWEICSLVRFRG